MIQILKLVAVHDGEGWMLEVQTHDGDCAGIIEWPWPYEEKTSAELKEMGWEIQ